MAERRKTRDQVETECKLIAPDAASLEGLEAALREVCDEVEDLGVERIQDVYLDTEDWRLYRAGLACRIRRAGGAAVVTLKALLPARDLVSVRSEFERRLDPAPAAALRRVWSGLLGPRVAALAGGKPLRRLFRVENRRRTFRVRLGERLVAHVAADDFVVRADRRSRRFAEVEIEAVRGGAAGLRRLARRLTGRLGLTTGTRTKFEEGLRLGRHTPPAG